MAICWPRWCDVCVSRRIITHALARDIEECSRLLPPVISGLAESLESTGAVLSILLDELESSLHIWQWRRSDVNAEHRPEPGVLANTLMDHVLVNALATRIVLFRAHTQASSLNSLQTLRTLTRSLS